MYLKKKWLNLSTRLKKFQYSSGACLTFCALLLMRFNKTKLTQLLKIHLTHNQNDSS